MHHDTTKPQVIESFNRKIKRTQNLLSSSTTKIFIYYRHFLNLNSSLDKLVHESLEFCEMYKNKYNNDNFVLLSLIVYEPQIDINEINKNLVYLRKKNNKNLIFDFLYKRNDYNQELNKLFINSWNNIFKKYNI